MTADPVADLARREREMEEAVTWADPETGHRCARVVRMMEGIITARRALVAQGWRHVWVGPQEKRDAEIVVAALADATSVTDKMTTGNLSHKQPYLRSLIALAREHARKVTP
jgi:hypothetical protein